MTETSEASGPQGPSPEPEKRLSGYLAKAFYTAALAVIAVVALVYASGILVPLAVALLFWFFVNALARMYEGLWRNRFGRLRSLSLILAFVTLLAASLIIAEIVVVNVSQMSTRTADFERSLNILIDKIASLTGVSNDKVVSTVLSHLSLDRFLSAIVSGLTGLVSKTGVVFIYVIFLLIEQRFFNAKLSAVVARRRQAPEDPRDPRSDCATTSRATCGRCSWSAWLTAILSYAVMALVGLDSAPFWAFLIFVLNFIPTVGSILATAIPALYALLQFGEISPFVVLLLAIGAIQFVIGNIIQPRMAAQTLNLSQFVVILSLFVWGAIWGIGGLFLAVPLTAVADAGLLEFPADPAARDHHVGGRKGRSGRRGRAGRGDAIEPVGQVGRSRRGSPRAAKGDRNVR